MNRIYAVKRIPNSDELEIHTVTNICNDLYVKLSKSHPVTLGVRRNGSKREVMFLVLASNRYDATEKFYDFAKIKLKYERK